VRDEPILAEVPSG